MKYILLAAIMFCGVYAPGEFNVPSSMLETAKKSGLKVGKNYGELVRSRTGQTLVSIEPVLDYSGKWRSLRTDKIDDPDVYRFLLEILPGSIVRCRNQEYQIRPLEKMDDNQKKSILYALLELAAGDGEFIKEFLVI